MQTALADIRRIAYNLRPPALDELGLLPALKEYLDAYNISSSLHFDFDAPEHLPPLSDALEGAIYRIVVEAITNVKRHANAQHCRVRLSLDESLCLEITDDGRGLQPGVRYGVGLIAMQERAAELGGTCQVEARSGRGTRVTAQLPCQGRVTGPGPAPHDDDEKNVMAVPKSAVSGETMQNFLNNISRFQQGRGERRHG